MSALIQSTLVDRAYDPNIRMALSLEDGAEYYFELTDRQASQLASSLSMAAHDVDENRNESSGDVQEDEKLLAVVEQGTVEGAPFRRASYQRPDGSRFQRIEVVDEDGGWSPVEDVDLADLSEYVNSHAGVDEDRKESSGDVQDVPDADEIARELEKEATE